MPLTVLLVVVQYLNNTLVPWPEPVGSNKLPVLLSSNADGIHSLGASLGPTVIGNTLANSGDDAIAIHGLYFTVAKVGHQAPIILNDHLCRVGCCPPFSAWLCRRLVGFRSG